MQADASWRINDTHTLRGGFLGQVKTTVFDTTSFMLPVNAMGAQTSNVPLSIFDNGDRTGGLYGVYLQVEWRLLPALTLNNGLRFDAVHQFTNENPSQPARELGHRGHEHNEGPRRLFALFRAAAVRTRRAGGDRALQQYDGRLHRPAGRHCQGGAVAYFDVGVNQIFVPGLTIGLDGYYKLATNLIDEGQFGAPIILSAFNYAKAYVAGAEFTVSYDQGQCSVYGNAAYSRAMGTLRAVQFRAG